MKTLLILVIIIFFYLLILFQTSFLVHFDIFSGKLINYSLVLIPVTLISFLTPQNQFSDLIITFSAGFFLDIFFGSFIGFHILILIGLVMFIKFILQKHVKIPTIKIY